MKNIVFGFALVFFGQEAYCNKEILSKFHQNAYKLKDVRIQLMSYNKEYFNFYELKAFKYNRTTTAHNTTFNFKVDVRNKLEFLIQVQKFRSNEYRHFPIRIQLNAQKCWESNAFGLHALSKCGNITTFDFRKNITYHACHYVVDETQLPPLIPSGKYRTDITGLHNNTEVAVVYAYSEVYTPIAYPKY